MIKSEGTVNLSKSSKSSLAQLYWQKWLPDAAPVAVIMLVHGYDEHSDRYNYFAKHCTDHGYAVYAIDHWGHGKSDGIRGFVPSFIVYHEGLDLLRQQINSDFDNTPLVLVGHSLGGLIGASYMIENQQKFKAAILSGAAIVPAEEPSAFLKFISRLLSKLIPKLGVLSLDANGISRDPQVVADYRADPLVSGSKISARLAMEMMKRMEWVQAQAKSIFLPMLILHGEKDSLTAPQGSAFLFENISSQNKKLIIYPELFHEIFNEPEKDKVLGDMIDWLGRVLTSNISELS